MKNHELPNAEVWLVVGFKFGAINQTLLTLEKLKLMGRTPARIFFNATKPACNEWIAPTQKAVEPFLPSTCLVHSLDHNSLLDPLLLL